MVSQGSFFVIWFLLFSFLQGSGSEASRRVLVFGGNGFIGSETVSRLIERGDDITLVNRGNWYFDSKHRIKPFIRAHIKCDRDKAMRLECPELLESGYYDVVLDFSSYTAQHIQQVVDILRGRVGVYIYISTDSVYEVCHKKHKGPTREEDAVRPKSPKRRLKLKKTDKYGHEKLACEEVLKSQRKAEGFPFVTIRLPDVIGPRDGSFRFWIYQLWLRVHRTIEYPVHLPHGVANTKFSLVHVEDVAKGIMRVLEVGPKAFDQAINLAFVEHFTLKKFLEEIAKDVNIKAEDIIWLEDEDIAWHTYPTVTKGPLDINRAKLLLDWNPMTWYVARKSLVKFFDDAMTDKKYSDEKEMVLADFMEYHVPEEKSEIFLHALEMIYGKGVFDGIDLDLGFGKDAMEIEGKVGTENDTSQTGNETGRAGSETGSETGQTDGEEEGESLTVDAVEEKDSEIHSSEESENSSVGQEKLSDEL